MQTFINLLQRHEQSIEILVIIFLGACAHGFHRYAKRKNSKNPYDESDIGIAILEGYVSGMFFWFLGLAMGYNNGFLMAVSLAGALLGYKSVIELHDTFIVKLQNGIKNFISGFNNDK